MPKILDEQAEAAIVNTIIQSRDRLGQHAYSKRPLDAGLQVQLAQALESALRMIRNLPQKSQVTS